ncbi:MBL fold metallo-hydrolase [Streptomyces violascens]|uniref:MBL fold metallo-hydrolase n=1 Tax=Streptomyces violascens TaxID=67381 RepID=UPI0036584151
MPVDAGLPGHLGQLQEHLAGSGRSLGDIRTVLLTHGHLGHTGLAGTVQEAGADIWIHEADAAILTDGPRSSMRPAKPERSMLSVPAAPPRGDQRPAASRRPVIDWLAPGIRSPTAASTASRVAGGDEAACGRTPNPAFTAATATAPGDPTAHPTRSTATPHTGPGAQLPPRTGNQGPSTSPCQPS